MPNCQFSQCCSIRSQCHASSWDGYHEILRVFTCDYKLIVFGTRTTLACTISCRRAVVRGNNPYLARSLTLNFAGAHRAIAIPGLHDYRPEERRQHILHREDGQFI